MQGPTQKCKKGRSQGIRSEFGDSASQKQTGLTSPLGNTLTRRAPTGAGRVLHEGSS